MNAWLASVIVAFSSAGTQPILKGQVVITPFEPSAVTLHDGPLKRQRDEVEAYYLSIPNDDLLKGFRKRAGKPAPGVDLGGWYTDDVFHVFGQIVSGLARLYAATGDRACRDKAVALVEGWAACIEPDGFFFYSRRPNAAHYTYEKTLGGLVDMAVYAHYPKATQYLEKITDWAIKNLPRDATKAYRPDLNYTEWYTLSENLYRAYALTGKAKYREFAKVWEYTWYWDTYAENQSIFDAKPYGQTNAGYHAYSHMNTLSGAGMAYQVTSQKHYLDTLRNAYDFFQREECFATGGFGPDETLMCTADLKKRLATTHKTFETQCGSWATFKLCKYLMILTGDARYGDWIEKMTLNGIGANVPMTPDGRVLYYSDYNTTEATKTNIDFGWSCCTGTRPEAVAEYSDLIYFKDPTSLYINLFVPSTVKWNGVQVTQRSMFPEDSFVDLTVHSTQSKTFSIRIRRPGWQSEPMRALVNDEPCPLKKDAHGWLVVKRKWKNNDRLIVGMPMRLWVAGVGQSKGYPAALMYGPVAMAIRFTDKYPLDIVNLEFLKYPRDIVYQGDLGKDFVESPGDPLTFHWESDPGVLIRPFYAFKEGEPYVLYVDPSAARRIPSRMMTTTGRWNQGALWFTNEVGATISATFEGSGVRWLGYRYDDGGIVTVEIDGTHVETVDLYGPARELPFNWKITGLKPGKHTIRLTLTAEKNPASKDRYINAIGFEKIE